MKMADLPTSVRRRLVDDIQPPPPRNQWGSDPDDPTLTIKQGRVLALIRLGIGDAAVIAGRLGERASEAHRVLRALERKGRVVAVNRGPRVIWQVPAAQAPHYLPPVLRSMG